MNKATKYLILSGLLFQAGCSSMFETIGTLAYDRQLYLEQRRCDAAGAWPERQACTEKLNAARQQADAARKQEK